MKIVITIFLYFSLASTAGSATIYDLINKGMIDEAADSLSKRSTAALRDGNTLFFLGLLESDAAEATRLMKAALAASVDHIYREELQYRLAQYYFVTERYGDLGRIVSEYNSRWEDGRYEPEMQRFSIAMDQSSGELESAIRQIDRYLLDHHGKNLKHWGLIDKARLMIAFKKKIGATKLLRKLSREKDGPGVPQALYLLAQDVIDRKRSDDAVFYYNILRESYPLAVGLDALVDRLADMPSGDDRNVDAEARTGTYYSVQVGVFSNRGNAKRQAKLFEQYGHKVDVKKKDIAGKTYRVVFVGRIKNFAEAVQLKKSLEAKQNETYRVIAR